MPEPRSTSTQPAINRILAAALGDVPPADIAALALREALALTDSAAGWVVERDARGHMENLAHARAAAPTGPAGEPLGSATARALWNQAGSERALAVSHRADAPGEAPGAASRFLVVRLPAKDDTGWLLVVADRPEPYQPREGRRLLALGQALASALQATRRIAAFRVTEALVDGSADGLAACDPDGVLIHANPAFLALWGQGPGEIEGWSLFDLYERQDEQTGEVQVALVEGRPWSLDVVATPAPDTSIPILLRGRPLRDPLGQLCGATVAARDTLREREIEDRAWHAAEDLARSNRDLEVFASAAARELQEPLRKILAFGEFLRADCGHRLDPLGRDYLGRMLAAAERQQELVNGLLRYARIQGARPSFDNVDLNQVARDVIADLRDQITATAGSVQLVPLPSLSGDQALLRILLRNLVENGLRFHRHDRPPVVRIGGSVEAGWCEILVEDDGIGFDEGQIHRLFKVFGRLHGRDQAAGTGLGLTICQRIAELHGGTITASSPPAGGAVFAVALPMVPRRAPPAATDA